MSDWIGWIEIALETTLLAIALIAVYDGARRIARDGLTRWASLTLAVGLLLPVYDGGISLTVPAKVREQLVEQSAMRMPEPAGGWEKLVGTPEQRALQSANAALVNFMVSGRLTPYLDTSGQRLTFAPTQQQLDAREAVVRDQKGAEATAQEFFERGARMLLTAFVSGVLGLIVGAVQRRRATR